MTGPGQTRPVDVLGVALWIGLVGGFGEAAGQLITQALWRQTYVSPTILWVAPLFDALLFGVVAAVAGLGVVVLPRLPWVRIAAFGFLFLALDTWLIVMLRGPIGVYALQMVALGASAACLRWFLRREDVVLRGMRRSLPWLAAAVPLTAVAVEGGAWVQERRTVAALPPGEPDDPNVVVVVLDAVRADHLGSYGYARETSPTVDRLAAEGVLFERALAPSSFSLSSHASILTGQYPGEHGVEWTTGRRLRACACPWLPTALRSRGYLTLGVSSNPFWFTRDLGFDRDFVRFEDYFHNLVDALSRPMLARVFHRAVLVRFGGDDIPRRSAEDVNAEVLDFLEDHDDAPDRPFLAVLNYFDAHDPYRPPEPFRSRFAPGSAQPGGLINQWSGPEDPTLTSAEVRSEVAAYDGGIAYADHALGQLLASLAARPHARQTLVIVTADHGESFGERGFFMHSHSLHREVIHVPLVIWWPGVVPGGVRIARPVTNTAIAATVMDLIGADAASFRRIPLSRLWNEPAATATWPPPLSEQRERPWGPPSFPSTRGSLRSVLVSRWHCIEHDEDGLAVYDWVSDPEEATNLAGRAEFAEAVRACTRALASSRPASAP